MFSGDSLLVGDDVYIVGDGTVWRIATEFKLPLSFDLRTTDIIDYE